MLVPLVRDRGADRARARELELHILEREIAVLAAGIDAATWRLLELIREFDEMQGWSGGWQSCAHWLNWRVGIGIIAAREKVRVAHALKELPEVSEAFRTGILSYSKVRAITRIATPALEHELVAMARWATTHHVEKIVRMYRKAKRCEENRRAASQHDDRHLRTYFDEDGCFVIEGRLSPEVGAVVMKALESAYRVLREDEKERGVARGVGGSGDSPDSFTRTAPACDTRDWRARRADALGLVAESALAGGLAKRAGADRAAITVHIDREVLADPGAEGRSELEGGAALAADTARRLACDAAVVEVTRGKDGSVLDVGRKTRAIPTPLRRALETRDSGCRFPGCPRERYLEAHHIVHWANGGGTNLDNLVQLCWYHHRALHEGGLTATREPGGTVVFRRPGGWIIEEVPEPLPAASDPAAELGAAESRGRGGTGSGRVPARSPCIVRDRRAMRLGRAASFRGRRAEPGGPTRRKQGRPRGSRPGRR